MTKSIEEMINSVVSEKAVAFLESIHDALSRGIDMCESPIEKMMFVRLSCLDSLEMFHGNGRIATIRKSYDGRPYREDSRVSIVIPQYQIGRYRADFMLSVVDDRDQEHRFVIECDGHDFHEKTKEQAAKDKARDRYMTAHGYRVFRYTGSEIYADKEGLLSDLDEALYNLLTFECEAS